jgi:hypothetical protein
MMGQLSTPIEVVTSRRLRRQKALQTPQELARKQCGVAKAFATVLNRPIAAHRGRRLILL